VPWTALTPRQASQRAYRELRHNPARSNELIARQAGVGHNTVSLARARLEAAGAIPRIPVSERQRQPYPRQPSRTRDAIAAGAITPRQIADAAQVSPQAGWRAWKKNQAAIAQAREAAAASRKPPPVQALPAPVPDLSGAACATGQHLPPSAWTGGGTRAERIMAIGICRSLCPQLRACRAWALGPGTSPLPGILGGLTEGERRQIRHNRKQAAAAR
jgi:Transcription factor WhiB